MKSFISALLLLVTTVGYTQKADTVKISLGKTSTIIFTMEDAEDLEILKHYNFQRLFMDVLNKLEKQHRLAADSSTIADVKETQAPEDNGDWKNPEEQDSSRTDDDWQSRRDNDHNRDDGSWEDDNDNGDWEREKIRWHRTRQSFNFDLGLNNILEDGSFPDESGGYAVRPWGSWYAGIASVQRSRVARNFFVEWGLGLNWYTFKFENDNTLIVKNDDGIIFMEDPRDVDFIKSKLSVSFIQVSLIPVIDFNDRYRKHRFWDGHKDSFRIGFGPYAGYRISSRSKMVYRDDGRERDKNKDSFHLNNFRYGLRLQVGYRSTDLFFNYDMNELFKEGKGPSVNAISFGVIF
jgi:hypothetical protein